MTLWLKPEWNFFFSRVFSNVTEGFVTFSFLFFLSSGALSSLDKLIVKNEFILLEFKLQSFKLSWA